MNEYDDARIEDTVWWVCPTCGKVNTTTGDDMECTNWNCAEHFDSANFDWETNYTKIDIILTELWNESNHGEI